MTEAEKIIRDTYERQGVTLARFFPFLGKWAANSQYGYVLDWAFTQETAEQIAVAYYAPRMHLITQ